MREAITLRSDGAWVLKRTLGGGASCSLPTMLHGLDVLFEGEVRSLSEGWTASKSMMGSSQSGCWRSSRRSRPDFILRVATLAATLFQMETTTLRFSRTYTAAVDSDNQLPRYWRCVRGSPI